MRFKLNYGAIFLSLVLFELLHLFTAQLVAIEVDHRKRILFLDLLELFKY